MNEFYDRFKKENTKTSETKTVVRRRKTVSKVKDNGLGVNMESIMNAPYIPVSNTVVIRTLRATITHLSKLNSTYKHTLFNSKIPFPIDVESSKNQEHLKKTVQEFLSYLFCEFGVFKNGMFVPSLGLRSEIKKIIRDTEVEDGDSYREKEAFFTNGVLNLVESEMFNQLVISYPENVTKDPEALKQHMERLSNYIKQVVDPVVMSMATRVRNAVMGVVKEVCEMENITFPSITPKQKTLLSSSWNISENDAKQLNKIQASHLIDALLKKDRNPSKENEGENSLFRER